MITPRDMEQIATLEQQLAWLEFKLTSQQNAIRRLQRAALVVLAHLETHKSNGYDFFDSDIRRLKRALGAKVREVK